MNETDLILEWGDKGNLFPPLSARECSQSLTPIPQGVLRRTVNGTLVWVGSKAQQKFQSTICCKDKGTPAFDGLAAGVLLKVGCLQSLTQSVSVGTVHVQLEREFVMCHLYDSVGNKWLFENQKEKDLILPSGFPGGFVTYRPWLKMIVKSYYLETNEWGLSVGWRLELEEA